MRLAILLLLAAEVISFAGPVSAAEALPVRLLIQLPAGRPRSQAPQTLELTLTSHVDSLLEGELELSIFVGRRLIQEYRSHPLVIGADGHRFRIVIPPIALHNDQTPVTAVARFIGNRQTFDLEQHDLVVPPQWKRWFVLAISRPEEEATHHDRFSIEMALAPERFNSIQGDLTDILTSPSVMSPASFPSTSTAYSSFDVVLLEGAGFTQLRDSQLSALAEWVEAGGSVVVRPTGVLKPGHLAILNRLASARSEDPSYVLDERGRIDPASKALTTPVARYHSGLGRSVVLHQPRNPDEDFSTAEWVEIAMFVWKIRENQKATVRSSGKWDFFLPRGLSTDELERPRLFAPHELPLEAPLRALLIPEKVQGLPFWVVVSILVVFLLLIAPGDYFLLGAFRARRLTWISLTVTSLAFTVGTVHITGRVMGKADFRRSLVFADLGAGNRPVKISRYELLFTATQKTMESHFQDELYVGIDDKLTRPAILRTRGAYSGLNGLPEDELSPQFGLTADLPEYVGKLPADYVVLQQMRQWSPLVSRQTSFGGSIAVPKLNWDGLAELVWEIRDGRRELWEAVQAVEPQARVLLFHGPQMFDLAAEEKEFASTPVNVSEEDSFVVVKTGAGTFRKVPTVRALPGINIDGRPDPLADLVRRACIAPQHGMFSIVSQIAPTGGDGFEDLALVDPTDSAQWLLVVIVPRGDDQVVFRKVYRRGE